MMYASNKIGQLIHVEVYTFKQYCISDLQMSILPDKKGSLCILTTYLLREFSIFI